jgi:hypothetical protein
LVGLFSVVVSLPLAHEAFCSLWIWIFNSESILSLDAIWRVRRCTIENSKAWRYRTVEAVCKSWNSAT